MAEVQRWKEIKLEERIIVNAKSTKNAFVLSVY